MSVLGSIGTYFKKLGLSLIGQLQASIASFLNDFVKDDLGKLAVDAVDFAESSLPGAAGTDKKAAAVAKLKEDAAKAGHDLTTFGESVFNFLIETALQAVLAAANKGILSVKE